MMKLSILITCMGPMMVVMAAAIFPISGALPASAKNQEIDLDKTSPTRVFYNQEDRSFRAKFLRDSQGTCTILFFDWVRKFRGYGNGNDSPHAIHVSQKAAAQLPADDHEHDHKVSSKCGGEREAEESKIFEIYSRQKHIVQAHMDIYCKSTKDVEKFMKNGLKHRAEPEVRKIVDSGDEANRIDVVFMGDGYTLAEREEFFEDMARLTRDMFEGVTFKSYLPLFNIWAIFVESVDSGIGYNGPQNTPFQLYREAGELRVIWPGNTGYARTICQLAGDCDFPSLIANDDYYGGLGGEFVISTRSNRTGTFVLRHEMGHSFGNFGDEYDNSWAYDGVNSAPSVASLGWTHWLTNEVAREERAVSRIAAYPWHDLSQGSQKISFTSDGTFSRWYLLVSVSAAGEADCLEFLLDGQILPWTSTGFEDREFYFWDGTSGFTSGAHELVVTSKTNSTHEDIPRMICSVNLHEFGSEDEFVIANDHVSAYPTWSDQGQKTFRPTNGGCLMRNMSANTFCNVCKEGLWTQFFQTVSLIDEVNVQPGQLPDDPSTVTLRTLKLAQFREPGNEVEGEELHVRWYKDGIEQAFLADQFEILADTGSWRVEAEFLTSEVKFDPNSLLNDATNFVV